MLCEAHRASLSEDEVFRLKPTDVAPAATVAGSKPTLDDISRNKSMLAKERFACIHSSTHLDGTSVSQHPCPPVAICLQGVALGDWVSILHLHSTKRSVLIQHCIPAVNNTNMMHVYMSCKRRS